LLLAIALIAAMAVSAVFETEATIPTMAVLQQPHGSLERLVGAPGGNGIIGGHGG
jgi:hypothetical protein